MTYANKALRQQYRIKAHIIGSNAITLVNEYFDVCGGIEDKVNGDYFQWTLIDLDRALYEMQKHNLGKAEKWLIEFHEAEFVNSHDTFKKVINCQKKWKELKS